LAGALLFDDKICLTATLLWFGLRNVVILYSRAVIHRTIDVSPAFLEHVSEEKTVIQTSRILDSFLHEASQNFELLSNILRSKIKNKKPIAVDDLFKAYPMVPLSCGSNLAR
jgi:hypothetical protein